MSVKVTADALEDAAMYFQRMPEIAAKSASLAINQVVDRQGLRLAADAIYEQVAFPKDYLKGDRLTVSQRARPNNLIAVIKARKRATSLARFAQGTPIGGGQFIAGGGRAPNAGVRVTVRPGNATVMRAAFLVRLNKGASMDEDNYNVGLAVRVKAGETIKGKSGEHQSWLVKPTDKRSGVALLYGPSVDQVFSDVAGEISDPMLKLVSAEFFRQFTRLSV